MDTRDRSAGDGIEEQAAHTRDGEGDPDLVSYEDENGTIVCDPQNRGAWIWTDDVVDLAERT